MAAAKRRPTFKVARRRGISPALKKAKAQLASSRKRARGLAVKAKGNTASLKSSGIVVAGGAASGALDAYMPLVAGIDSRYVVGVAAVAAGTFAFKGMWGSVLTLAGAGILAAAASETVSDMLLIEEVAA